MQTTHFERALFFSWGCAIGDCTFCYMSTQPPEKKVKETRRSVASLLAEALLCKKLGWKIGFVTGGIGVFTPEEFVDVLDKIVLVYGEKVWLSVGPLSREHITMYLPYAKGFVASTETVNPKLHTKVCPSKPLAPYEQFLATLRDMQIPSAITIIVGIGETFDDIPLTRTFIEKYNISKLHLYGLNSTPGTAFSTHVAPDVAYQAHWISSLREAFPTLDIQCGIWNDRPHYVSSLLRAGANSISKLSALRLFGSEVAYTIENETRKAGRDFLGTLTQMPDVDWDAEISAFPFSESLKKEIAKKLAIYLKQMQKCSSK